MIIVLAHERVSSINEHTYNSLILHHSTRLIESIRSSSCLIKILHYWMLKSSSTRKPHSRNARGKFSRAKRVAKQWDFRNFSTTLAILKRFSIWFRKTHLLYVKFSYIYFLSNHRVVVVAIQSLCVCLFVYDNFWSSSK